MNEKKLLRKLLSHRIREFSEIDNTCIALKNASEHDIAYFEIDTRVSKDDKIYVYHDSVFKQRGIKFKIRDKNASYIDGLIQNKKIVLDTLDDFLSCYKEYISNASKLVVDIKDFGAEEKHLELIRKYDLVDKVVFVTWIPHTIRKLHEIAPEIPIILAYIPLNKLGGIGSLIAYALRNSTLNFGEIVLLGENKINAPLGEYKKGFQHAIVTTEVSEDLIKILKKSKGGVCIERLQINDKILSTHRKQGLEIWIFGITTFKGFLKYAGKSLIDVVFCDVAYTVIKKLK